MDERKLLVLSIGNPGPSNRHSVGHLALKYLMQEIPSKQLVKPSGRLTYSISRTDDCIFVKSNTYMNESATALKHVIADEKLVLSQTDVVVLYDDFEMKLGQVKLGQFKKNESHNGIKSIKNFAASLNQHSIVKLGVGIGPKPENSTKDTMAKWVLSPFNQTELECLQLTSFPTVFVYIHTLQSDIHTLRADGIDVNKVNAKVKKLIDNS